MKKKISLLNSKRIIYLYESGGSTCKLYCSWGSIECPAPCSASRNSITCNGKTDYC